MGVPNEQLREALVRPGHVSQKDFEAALDRAQAQNNELEDVLIDGGYISEENLGRVLADVYDVKFLDLRNETVQDTVLYRIPEIVAKEHEVIAFEEDEESVHVGMRRPDDLATVHMIQKLYGKDVEPYYITNADLMSAFARYKSNIKEEVTRLVGMFNDPALSDDKKDQITIDLVDMLLQYGYENKASDIHIEPYEKKILVRFRIDGVMHDIIEIPKELNDLILTRIKILSKMRTDEHQAAQDGKLRFKIDSQLVDVRVSVIPVTRGEKVVMRILAALARSYSLTDLGFSDADLKKAERAIKHPNGMILVTGPTGSGKTTTLYAFLKILNKRVVNIMTIEDPVEYDIEGVNQIQVNTRTGLTFAKGLRSIVRQDPDIIMVGEIRDADTAGIGVNAALTGHLVLSTLHTNDAATTLPRLIDMGVEPYLISSTVNVIIAQRLVRKICESCRISVTMTPKQKKSIQSDMMEEFERHLKHHKKSTSKITVYEGKGCPLCSNTGYQGRVGIFEVLEVSDRIREMILQNASADEIARVAVEEGMTTMFQDGVDKVINGVTTIEEVFRVTRD